MLLQNIAGALLILFTARSCPGEPGTRGAAGAFFVTRGPDDGVWLRPDATAYVRVLALPYLDT